MPWKLLLALCIAALPLSEAAAVPLPAASYTVDFDGIPVASVPGSYASGGKLAELATLPAPSAHVHLNGAGTSYAQLQYWFRVEGPVDGVEVPNPLGAFYVYPDVRGLLNRDWNGTTPATSLELADLILEQAEVAVVPGEAFGPSGYLRLSYALGDEQQHEGVQRLQRLFS